MKSEPKPYHIGIDALLMATNQRTMTVEEFRVQYALGSLSDDMKWTAANDPRTPIEVLTILSTDRNWLTKRCVAGNPNTPVRVLTKLSTDEHAIIRGYVGCNPNTPKEVRDKLANDKDNWVRWRTAFNPKARFYNPDRKEENE